MCEFTQPVRSTQFPVAPHQRLYAIGDIHGRMDLLEQLLEAIEDDSANRKSLTTRIILLGDLVDRGPDSAEVVRRCLRWSHARDRFIVLAGNHERMMVQALDGDINSIQAWFAVGGKATLRSWGVAESLLREGPMAALLTTARDRVGAPTLAWMRELPLSFRSNRVLFVHAGIRPRVRLKKQSEHDLTSIRGEFTEHPGPHPALIVHGHSVTRQPAILSHRIGIDTGAYRSGRLTAVGLEGELVWTLSTC